MRTQNRPQTPIRRERHLQSADSKWARHQVRLLELREHFLPANQKGKVIALPPNLPDSSNPRFDNYDQNLALALLAHERHPLQEIDAALKRIEEGIYGVCERTGKAIDPSRLNALPWARSCNRAERIHRSGRFAHH